MPYHIKPTGFTAGLLMLFAAMGHSDAHACGASAEEVVPLLPEPGATDVPLNVVLQASSALSRADFELVEDATDTLLPLSISCDGHFDGNLCLASAGPLEPNTAYRWRAFSGSDEPSVAQERSFVTGDSADDYSPVVNSWSLDVLDDQPQAQIGCGTGRRVTFEFTVNDTDEPLVLAVPGRVPDVDQHALLVSPGTPVEFDLAAPPPCFSIRLTDVAGNAKAFPAYCFETLDEAQPVLDSGVHDDPPPEDPTGTPSATRSGCSFLGQTPPPPLWFGLLLLPLVVALRRRYASPRLTEPISQFHQCCSARTRQTGKLRNGQLTRV